MQIISPSTGRHGTTKRCDTDTYRSEQNALSLHNRVQARGEGVLLPAVHQSRAEARLHAHPVMDPAYDR